MSDDDQYEEELAFAQETAQHLETLLRMVEYEHNIATLHEDGEMRKRIRQIIKGNSNVC